MPLAKTRLDDRFRLLTGGSRTALPRQQTLRATLDWSYDLLHEPERVLLRRLAIFAGGWTLGAAEALCAGHGITPVDILDLLTALVKKSLVLVEEGSTSMRYRLLETIRQYGREKLEAAGEAVRLADRHLAWYLTLAAQAAPALEGPEQVVWLDRLEVELENLRAALAWSGAAAERRERGVRLAAALGRFWIVRGRLSEGRRWLERLLEPGGIIPPALRVHALNWLNAFLLKQGDPAHARTVLEESCTICAAEPASAVPAVLPLAGMTPPLASRMLLAGDPRQAAALLEAALPGLGGAGDRQGIGWARCTLGILFHMLGDYSTAATRYEESLAVFEELGDTYSLGHQLANLANAARAG